jgi:hypothetical protein
MLYLSIFLSLFVLLLGPLSLVFFGTLACHFGLKVRTTINSISPKAVPWGLETFWKTIGLGSFLTGVVCYIIMLIAIWQLLPFVCSPAKSFLIGIS